MKKILTVAIAATAIAATPAAAQDSSRFQGGHVGVNAGFSDTDFVGFEEFNYGIEAGYNHDTGGAVIGISGELNDNNDIKRELAAVLRAGGKVGNNGLIFVSGGYSNIRAFGINLDGVRVGVGGEMAFGQNGYAKVEQIYSDYELGVDFWTTRVGVGFRF